jgi:arylsulfatase A-like enzyme
MLGSRGLGAACPFAAPPEESGITMIRGSLPTAVAVAFAVVSTAVHDRSPPVIPPNFVGTWRLDSLLDQAQVEGPDPSDVDPAFFVLRNVHFENDAAGTEALKLKFGEGTVERAGKTLKLHATGKFAAFTIPVDPAKPTDWSTLAIRVKSDGAKELAVLSDPGMSKQLKDLSDPPAAGPFGPGRRGQGLFPIPVPDKKAAKPDEKKDEKAGNAAEPAVPADGKAAAPSDGAAAVPAPAPGAPPAGAPQAGAPANPPPAAPPPAGGSVVMNIGGMNVQLGPNGFNFDPLQIVHNAAAKLEDDGEWHTIARTRVQTSGTNAVLGMMGAFGPRQQEPELKTLTLLLAVPPEKEKEGVSVEIEFIHVLDAKVDYAKATAATTSIERHQNPRQQLPVRGGSEAVIHQGMYLNTTASVSWTLVPPPKGRLLAGVTGLTSTPWDLSVYATADGKREQLQKLAIDDPAKIESLDVDLSKYAGRTTTLTIEAADHGDPAVAFLLQPIVYGQRKEGVKNVLLYFCDTLRADGLGCYGNQRGTTPNLDAIAADGVRFERCFSQGPWTYVSMPSSLSSLFPSVDGVRTGGEQIPDSCTTMAEAFRNAGYLTCAMIRNDFVGRTTHTEQGFDFFFPAQEVGPGPANNAALAGLLRAAGQNPDAIGGAGGGFESGSSRDLFAAVEPWLAKYKEIPFFLYLHSVEPHGPYKPPAEELAKFGGEEARKTFEADDSNAMAMTPNMPQNVGGNPINPNPNPPPAPNAKKPVANAADFPAGTVARQFADLGIDPKEHAKLGRDLYDAAIHYMDTYVGKVVERMKQLGYWDHMVFSFNADHGEEFFDHNNSGHGQSVYAELNHVPWILHAPGLLPTGKLVHDNAMNLDLAPTLLTLAGLAPAESMQGRSLAESIAKDEEFTPTMIVTELWGGGIGMVPAGLNFNGNMEEEVLGQFSVIEGRWKTIIKRYHKAPPAPDGGPAQQTPRAPPGFGPGGPPQPPQPPGELVTELQVYDLDADLTDSHPVTDDRQEEAQQTLKRFLAWVGQMKEIRKRYANEKSTSDDAAATLRALGYAR